MKNYIIIHNDASQKSKKQLLFFLGTLITLLLLMSNFKANAEAGNSLQMIFEYDGSGNIIKREYKNETCSTYYNSNLRIASNNSIHADLLFFRLTSINLSN